MKKFIHLLSAFALLAFPLVSHAQCDDGVTSCSITIQCTDSYGDGWNGASIKVYQGTVLRGTVSGQGSSSSSTVAVCADQQVRFEWNSGSYDYETGFTILNGDGSVIIADASGSSYSSGADIITADVVCPTCIAPTSFVATETSEESITLSWVDNNNGESDYSLIYVAGGETIYVGNISGNSYEVTGLSTSTGYTFTLRAICSDEDSSAAITKTFRTACSTMTLPYVEDWEGISGNGAWPDCWDSIIHAGTDPSANNVRNHTAGGQYSMYFQSTSSELYNLVVSSAVPLAGDAIHVTFWGYLSASNGWIKAGVMTDPHDTTTFIPLTTVSGSSWNEYEFTTAGLEVDPDASYYVAFMAYAPMAYSWSSTQQIGSVDDIIISEDLGCNRPNEASVSDVGPYSATLSWTTGGDAASDYTIIYGTSNNMNNEGNATIEGISDLTYNLTGLLPQTTYYAWVLTNCGSVSADPKSFGSFTTQLTCAPVTSVAMGDISYTMAILNWDFNTAVGFPTQGVQITLVDNSDAETAPVVYEEVEGTTLTLEGLTSGHSYTATIRNLCDVENDEPDTAAAVSITFMTESCSVIDDDGANQYVPTYTYYNYSLTQSIYKADQMPNIDVIHGISYKVTISSSTTRTVDVYMGHTELDGFSSGTAWVPSEGLTLVAQNASLDAHSTGWTSIVFDNDFVYDGQSNLIVVVDDNTGSWVSSPTWQVVSDATSQSLRVYSDGTNYDPANPSSYNGTVLNVVPAISFMADCEVPTCFAPMVTVSEIGENSITVNWGSEGEENEWRVGIKTALETEYTYVDGTVTAMTYTFNDLNPNTSYSIIVASICGDDELPTIVTAKTLCGPMALPFFANFEDDPTGAMPSCWTLVTPSSTYAGYPGVSTSGQGGGHALTLAASYFDSTMVAIGEVPLPGNQIYVNFWASVNNTATVRAGVMTDPTNPTTFIPLLSIPYNNSTYTEYEFNTSTLDPEASYYVAFRLVTGNGNNYSDLDNITIRLDDGCHRAENVTFVAETNILTLNWTINGSVEDYQLQYRQYGATEWSTVEGITGTTGTISDLQPGTNYEVRVGTVCSENDIQWTDPIIAATNCVEMVLPYSTSFESDIVGLMPACWSSIGAIGSYAYDDATYPAVAGNANTGVRALNITYINGTNIMATDVVPLAGNQIYCSFYAAVDDYYGDVTFEAGVMTDLTDATTFTPLVTIDAEDYEMFEFNTSTLSEEAEYHVAFRFTSTYMYAGAYIDDILIRQDDGCMNPAGLAANPAENSVTLTWTNAGTVGSFAVEYRTSGGAWSEPATTTETEYEVTGLNSSTTYEFRVGSICGNDTMWVNITMATTCGMAPVPYTENFSSCNGTDHNLPPCWNYNWDEVYFGDGGLFFRNYHAPSVAVLPLLDGAITKYQVSFDAKLGPPNSSTFDQIMIGLANNAGELVGWLDTLSDSQQSRSSFVHFSYRFNGQSLPGGTRVCFGHTFNGADWALIDNIEVVELPSCVSPEQVTVHNPLNPDSTYFTWNAPVDVVAQGWQVYVAPEDETEIDETAIVDVPATSFSYLIPAGVITGGQKYNFYVRTVCNDIEQSDWAVCNFASGQVISPASGADTVTGCGFVVYDNGGPIAGYITYSNSTVVLRPTDTDHKLKVTNGFLRLFFDGASTFTIYDGEGTDGAVLYQRTTTDESFYEENNGYEPIDINVTSTNGPLTINLNAGNYVDKGFEIFVTCVENENVECVRPLVQNVVPTTTTITVNYTAPAAVEAVIATAGTTVATVISEASPVVFENLTENTDYNISLRTICDEGVYSEWQPTTGHTLEEIIVEPDTCEVPSNVSVSDITQTTAVVSWTSEGNTWNIDINGTIIENVTANPYTLTGLTAGTNYSVRVQNVCEDIQPSDWSNGYGFNTLPADNPQGIDGVDGTAIVLYPNPASTTVTLSGINGSAQVAIVDMNGRTVFTTTANESVVIDLGGYAKGAYFVRVVGENTNSIRKLIVK